VSGAGPDIRAEVGDGPLDSGEFPGEVLRLSDDRGDLQVRRSGDDGGGCRAGVVVSVWTFPGAAPVSGGVKLVCVHNHVFASVGRGEWVIHLGRVRPAGGQGTVVQNRPEEELVRVGGIVGRRIREVNPVLPQGVLGTA